MGLFNELRQIGKEAKADWKAMQEAKGPFETNESTYRPETTDEYTQRRRLADDSRFHAFITKKYDNLLVERSATLLKLEDSPDDQRLVESLKAIEAELEKCENTLGDLKRFDLGAVLSPVTGRLLSSFDDVYGIVNHCTGEVSYTHSLPMFFEVIGPVLLEQYPFLQEIKDDLPTLDVAMQVADEEGVDRMEVVEKWLNGWKQKFGKELTIKANCAKVTPEVANPISSLIAMLGE